MDKVGGVIVAAGRGERMGAPINKAFLPLGGRPLFLHSVLTFEAAPAVDTYVVVSHPEDAAFCRALLAPYGLRKLVAVVDGGAIRQESAAAGVRSLPDVCCLVAVHDAARPLLSLELLQGAVERARDGSRSSSPGTGPATLGAALVVAVPAKETIKLVDESGQVRDTPDRRRLWAAQTPQIFRRDLLLRAYAEAERDGFVGTDDASLVERLGAPVEVYQGEYGNIKVTTPEDWRMAQALLEQRALVVPVSAERGFVPAAAAVAAPGSVASGLARPASVRVGIGYDVHPFDSGRPLFLGGVEIPEGPGLAGHSDADVALHALMDACLGAAGLRDIGQHFPPGDPRWKDAPSLALLASVRSMLEAAGYTVNQVDLAIAAETPRLAPYVERMQQRIGVVLGIPPGNVGIKATTSEGLGFVGRKEGIAVWAIATVVNG